MFKNNYISKVFTQEQVDFITEQMNFILSTAGSNYSGLFSPLKNDGRFEDFAFLADEENLDYLDVAMFGGDAYDVHATIKTEWNDIMPILEDIYLNGSDQYYPQF